MSTRMHDGRQGNDALWLWHAQTALRQRWGFNRVGSLGFLDAATQAAVAALQTRMGEDPTGYLDQVVWDYLWSVSPAGG